VELLAYLVASRFADHIPYYREEDILSRVGFSVHRATQWRWMRAVAAIVRPLVELMREAVMQSAVQGIDETPCPILCPERGRTRNAYLYAQYGDAAHPFVCFSFASYKNEENVRRIVGSYAGYLQSDAYICYELIAAASGDRIIAVGCWAHARRKFEPLIQTGPHPQATWILGEVQKLYDIEDRARDMTDDQRLALRRDRCNRRRVGAGRRDGKGGGWRPDNQAIRLRGGRAASRWGRRAGGGRGGGVCGSRRRGTPGHAA
jgi:transposase